MVVPLIMLCSFSQINASAYTEKNNASQPMSCHCVAFRLDDVQDYPYSSPLIEVMELFRGKNLPLTIGVVGNNIDTDTKQIYYYLKERLLINNSSIAEKNMGAALEIANHSWDHERFLNSSLSEQIKSITKTNEKVKRAFGVSPTLLIPPNNEFNDNSLIAMYQNNMTILSADERDNVGISKMQNKTIYHLPETAETGLCIVCSGKNYSWYGIEADETMKQVQKSINSHGFAIVVMHPMEYSMEHEDPIFQNSLDLNQVEELEVLLSKIVREGLRIITLENMTQYFS